MTPQIVAKASWVVRYSPTLVRLGGLASIFGGVLWVALLLFVQLQMLRILHFYDILEPLAAT
jgi:hypothetical protein